MKISSNSSEQNVLYIFSILSSIFFLSTLITALIVCVCCKGANKKPLKKSSSDSPSDKRDSSLKFDKGVRSSVNESVNFRKYLAKLDDDKRRKCQKADETDGSPTSASMSKRKHATTINRRKSLKHFLNADCEPPKSPSSPTNLPIIEPRPLSAEPAKVEADPGRNDFIKNTGELTAKIVDAKNVEVPLKPRRREPILGAYYEPPSVAKLLAVGAKTDVKPGDYFQMPIDQAVRQSPPHVHERETKRPSKMIAPECRDEQLDKNPAKNPVLPSAAIPDAKPMKSPTSQSPERCAVENHETVGYRVLSETQMRLADQGAAKNVIAKSPLQLAGPVDRRRAIPKAAYFSANVWRPPPTNTVFPVEINDPNKVAPTKKEYQTLYIVKPDVPLASSRIGKLQQPMKQTNQT